MAKKTQKTKNISGRIKVSPGIMCEAPWPVAFPVWQQDRDSSTISGLFQLVWELHSAAPPHALPNRAVACRVHTASPYLNPLFFTTSSSTLTQAVMLLLYTHITWQQAAPPLSSGCLSGVHCISEDILLFPYNFPSPHPKPFSYSSAPQAVFIHPRSSTGSAPCPAQQHSNPVVSVLWEQVGENLSFHPVKQLAQVPKRSL